MHATAQSVYHLGLIITFLELGKGSVWPAFVFTHWVSVPNLRKPAPVLALPVIAGCQLPDLG
jgi:hypothetical protein